MFALEAVSLGSLKRAIIGHDGTGPGQGWYLDKVVIKETPKGMSWAFPCDKLVACAHYQCYPKVQGKSYTCKGLQVFECCLTYTCHVHVGVCLFRVD